MGIIKKLVIDGIENKMTDMTLDEYIELSNFQYNNGLTPAEITYDAQPYTTYLGKRFNVII